MNKQQGWGRTPVRGTAWRQWVGGLLASAVLAGCGGGSSSTGAVAATAADDITVAGGADGTRARALAATVAPLIADGYLVLRNVADPTRLLAGPQPSSENQRPSDSVGLETPVFSVTSSTDAVVPPVATLKYTTLTQAEAAAQNLGAPLTCGRLTLRTPLASGNFLTVRALHVARSGDSGVGALTNFSGQPMWGSLVKGTAPSDSVCAEAAPGGQGLYLRWPDQPGKVLSLDAQGRFVMAEDPKTAAEIARASFVAQPVQAFVANQPPSITFDYVQCETFCGSAGSGRVANVPERKAGDVQTIPVTVSDPEGQLDRVELLNGDQVITTSRTAPYTLTWTPTVGLAHLTVRAWDKQGAWTVSDWVAIVKVPASADGALSAVIVAPAPGATVEAGWQTLQYRTADARGTSGLGGEKAYLKVDDRTVLDGCCDGVITGKVWLDPGTYRLTAWREDGAGAVVSSAAQTLTVVPTPNAPEISILTPTLVQSLKVNQKIRLTASVSGSTGPYRVRYLQRTLVNGCVDGTAVGTPFYDSVCQRPLDPAHPDYTVYLGPKDPAQPNQSVALGTAPYVLDAAPPIPGETLLYAEVTDAAGKVFRSKPLSVFVASLYSAYLQAPKVAALNQAVELRTDDPIMWGADARGRVEFYDGNTKIGTVSLAGPNPVTFSWVPQTSGAHQLFARLLLDGLPNRVYHTAVVRVYVKGPDNLPPVVRISSPTGGTGRLAGVPMVVKANPGDYDGYIRKVEFYDGGTLIGTATASPWSINWSGGIGAHSLVAKAFDNLGASTLSSPVELTLKASNVPPTVGLVVSAAEIRRAGEVTLSANPGDKDGFIRQVEFFVDGARIGAPLTARPWVTSVSGLSVGVHQLTVRATDNSDAQATSTVVSLKVIP